MFNSLNTEEVIPELQDFYLDIEANLKLVQIDDSKYKVKWSEEEKGQWALDQIEMAASVLLVTRFIAKGGDVQPSLEDISVYIDRHAYQSSEA